MGPRGLLCEPLGYPGRRRRGDAAHHRDEDQNQQWLGVADIMRAEAHEDANAALDRAAGRANGIAAITPERVIREGDPTDQILDVIDKDVDIAMLVLAANPGPEGPGPIITTMAKTVGSFPIP
jgi:nucleotide-binding universal stress UspA family protein